MGFGKKFKKALKKAAKHVADAATGGLYSQAKKGVEVAEKVGKNVEEVAKEAVKNPIGTLGALTTAGAMGSSAALFSNRATKEGVRYAKTDMAKAVGYGTLAAGAYAAAGATSGAYAAPEAGAKVTVLAENGTLTAAGKAAEAKTMSALAAQGASAGAGATEGASALQVAANIAGVAGGVGAAYQAYEEHEADKAAKKAEKAQRAADAEAEAQALVKRRASLYGLRKQVSPTIGLNGSMGASDENTGIVRLG